MSTTSTPLPFGGSAPAAAAADAREFSTRTRTLLDLLYDGFFMLFQLRDGQQPTSAEDFLSYVRIFSDDFDRDAKHLNVSAENVLDVKYAFCAAMGKTTLSPNFATRPAWGRRPLQLVLLGEQPADEAFFVKLEELRAHSAPRLQALEVFHMCLLLGFRGKYILEGLGKLAYLIARLGDEISAIKGKCTTFAPYQPLPGKVAYILKCRTPLWILGTVLALTGLLGFLGLSRALNAETSETLEGYLQVIRFGLRFPHLTISLL